MEVTFRASMNWLHTWMGVVLGAVLFAIFWMGSLAVFDKEIDRWMAPMTRLPVVEKPVSLDALRSSLTDAAAAKSRFWIVTLPTEREPSFRVRYREADGVRRRDFDPATGTELADAGTWAGTRFLYPFHYNLHIRIADIGIWLVGLAGMAMLMLCVSGVVIHRKIFADFFTFRPRKKSRRAILDLHNVVAVLGLPFHVAITLSGLIIYAAIYFPSGWQAVYKDRQAYIADAVGFYDRKATGMPGGPIASLDAMAEEARRIWDGVSPQFVQVSHPGDAAAFVFLGRSYDKHITISADMLWFDATTGKLLHRSSPTPLTTAQHFIAGMHLIQFRHWTLRWLYFAMGLGGCVMIATGYLFWLESRRKKHAQLGLSGVRIVEGLTIGSITGIIIATLAFFVANRLLPLGTVFAGYERAALEIWAFYLVWLGTFTHAWARPGRAWIEQCWTIAAFAVVAVLLNWITTGDHLVRSLAHSHLWAVGGMDLMMLAGAVVALLTARRLHRRTAAPERAPSARGAELHPAE